jgi:hypothetical protein
MRIVRSYWFCDEDDPALIRPRRSRKKLKEKAAPQRRWAPHAPAESFWSKEPKMTHNRHIASVLLAALAVLAPACLACADMMYYERTGLGQELNLHAPGTLAHNRDIHVGQMEYTYQHDTFMSYCVDLYSWAGDSWVTEENINILRNGNLVADLFLTYADSVADDTEAAGLQLAIWEVMYEDQSSVFDTETGSLRISQKSGTVGTEVAQRANTMLANMNYNFQAGDEPVVLHSPTKQDTILPSPVIPEPMTLGILAVGGAGIVVRHRRRRCC